MFELKIAITEQNSVSSQAVGALLWNIDSGIYTASRRIRPKHPAQVDPFLDGC